jgi:hypothetical protein
LRSGKSGAAISLDFVSIRGVLIQAPSIETAEEFDQAILGLTAFLRQDDMIGILFTIAQRS